MNEENKLNEATENEEVEIEEIEEPEEKLNWKKELMEWVAAIAIAVAVGLFLNNFVFTLVQVSGDSMTNTLQDGDRLFLISRYISKPDNGDIVVFFPENDTKPYIKRVIATEGQTVEVEFDYTTGEQRVYVDGEMLREDYVRSFYTNYGNMEYPLTVEEDHVFVMGDNRPNSHDSRQDDVGQVDMKTVRGKVLFRWWPFDKWDCASSLK